MNYQVGRNDPCPCGSGKKYKKCHGLTDSPIQINVDGRVIPFNAVLDSVTYHRRLAYLGKIGRRRKTFCLEYTKLKKREIAFLTNDQVKEAKSDGKAIFCHKGCSSCCDEVIPVRIQESEAIVHYLYQNENVLNAFILRYPAWYNQASKHLDILTRIAQAKNQAFFEKTGTIEHMQETVSKEAGAFWDLHIHCPFLVDRNCSIYEVRPYVCASVYSLDPECSNPSSKSEPIMHSVIVSSENLVMSFWDDRLAVVYEDVLPNIVFNTLTGGFSHLSTLPGLDQLLEDFRRDPEVHEAQM